MNKKIFPEGLAISDVEEGISYKECKIMYFKVKTIDETMMLFPLFDIDPLDYKFSIVFDWTKNKPLTLNMLKRYKEIWKNIELVSYEKKISGLVLYKDLDIKYFYPLENVAKEVSDELNKLKPHSYYFNINFSNDNEDHLSNVENAMLFSKYLKYSILFFKHIKLEYSLTIDESKYKAKFDKSIEQLKKKHYLKCDFLIEPNYERQDNIYVKNEIMKIKIENYKQLNIFKKVSYVYYLEKPTLKDIDVLEIKNTNVVSPIYENVLSLEIKKTHFQFFENNKNIYLLQLNPKKHERSIPLKDFFEKDQLETPDEEKDPIDKMYTNTNYVFYKINDEECFFEIKRVYKNKLKK